MYWRAVLKTIKAQVSRGEHLGQHDDLTGVHGEVFGDVEDRFQAVDVGALNDAALEQRFGSEVFKNGFDVGERRAQERQQLATADRFTLRELGVAIASINRAAHTRHNPLTRVTTQVQHEVADAV